MKIKTACDITGLTDRTIRYYIEEQLISPSYTENYLGRKSFDFSQEDIALLQNISVLRRFDFTIENIRGILNDPDKSIAVIQDVKARNNLALNEALTQQSVLSQIQDNRVYTIDELARELSTASEGLPTAEDIAKNRFIKTLLGAIKVSLTFLVVWLPVATQFLFFIVTLIIYSYPKFHAGAKMYMLLSVLPSILVVLLNRVRPDRRKHIRPVLFALCILSFLCSTVVGRLPVGILAESETTDIVDYRDFDAKCTADQNAFFTELFPASAHYFIDVKQQDGNWDTVYLDAHYYYRYKLSFDFTYDVYAQWPLEKEAFDKEVARVKALYDRCAAENSRNYVIEEKGNYTCLIAYDGDPPFAEATDNYSYYIFAFDEENLTVRYIACNSLENGADQPYYLSLDW